MNRIKGKFATQQQLEEFRAHRKAKGLAYINSVENPTVPKMQPLKKV
jgi:hypothetical protein